jgi:hypothetical protein
VVRGVVLFLLLIGIAAAVARPFGAPPTSRAVVDIRRPALETCGGCHADVYAEWAPTLHKRAWTNDNILRATQNFAKVQCRSCHSPEAVMPFPLETAHRVYRQPVFRDANLEDGVHCLSCHALGGASEGVAATRDVPGAPCGPRRDERLGSVAFCSTCHDPTHQAAQEYWTSQQAAAGVRCMDCHMAPVERAGGRMGRSHVFPGGFSAEQVRRGLDAKVRLEGRTVVVTLANKAAHKFPGEIPSRSLTVAVEGFDAKGERVLDRHTLIRRPFKTQEERDRVDDRLLPNETRELRETLPPTAERVHVRVIFRSLPLQRESQAIRIADVELRVGPPAVEVGYGETGAGIRPSASR